MNHIPAEAGTHLPTSEGWKAELATGGGEPTCWLAADSDTTGAAA